MNVAAAQKLTTLLHQANPKTKLILLPERSYEHIKNIFILTYRDDEIHSRDCPLGKRVRYGQWTVSAWLRPT